MEKLKMQTADMAERNVELLGQMFPNCLTETINADGKLVRAIDFDKLRQELACEVVEGADERYQFTWPDKRNAIRLANAPINKTLRPCREESVDFDNTENLYIEGDNLEVLKLLRENYLGKVKMIYIDPPYNTGNDFVYNDDFAMDAAEFNAQSGLFDEVGNRMADPMVQNTESNGRFHTDWFNMIYPRLKVAKDLLADDGVIFISIDDCEIVNAIKICSELFGQDNFVSQFIWKKKQGGGNDSSYVVAEHEYIVCFAKNKTALSFNLDTKYKLDDALYPYSDAIGDYGLVTLDKASIQFSQSLVYEIVGPNGEIYTPRIVKGKQSCWRWSKAKVEAQYSDLVFKNGKVYTKYYRPKGVTPRSLLIDAVYGRTESGNDDISSLFEKNPFSYPKPVALIHHFCSIASASDSLILDFFSGSATTAHAVMKLNAEDGGNRKFVMVQLPEKTDEKSEAYKAGYKNICEIGKERIRRAGLKIREELIAKRDKIKTELYDVTGGAAFATNPSSMNYFMANADDSKKSKVFQLNKEIQDLEKKIDSLDIGFRTLKLDESNMADVYYTPADTPIQATLNFDALVDNIREGRTAEDLLFQVLPECNLPLSSKIEIREIHGKKVFVVEDGYLMACFDSDINDAVITAIAKEKPYYFVMCDRSIASDSVADNFDQIFNAYSKDTVRRIL
ncbi:MAG: site-specific DNA-methyltransferase [Muribaculaceae bacterium]|nr:site-specific DNA-methyltransferase [Muribaculaceae bacterium]